MGCAFKNPDKSACANPAAHNWGPVLMCCHHFDLFVGSLLDLNEAIQRRRHTDFVDEYARQCQRASLLPGAKCDADKTHGES